MKVLVVEKDTLVIQIITNKLEEKGHEVTSFNDKSDAFDHLDDHGYDCVIIDPAPMPEARPVMIEIWKRVKTNVTPYIMILSKNYDQEQAVLGGANDVINKPISRPDLADKIDNAERLLKLCKDLGDEEETKAVRGMIDKDGFNQLFLSGIDRSFRYGERSFIVFIELGNYDEVEKAVGKTEAEDMHDKLLGKLVFMRRQSDVIGRTGKNSFAIILQRPMYETEPMDAITRFAEVLGQFYTSYEGGEAAPKLHLFMVELPFGKFHAERFIPGVNGAGIINEDDLSEDNLDEAENS